MNSKEKAQYGLCQTYLNRKFFISTMYRESSTIEPMWYFETIAWEWNDITKQKGSIIEVDDSGYNEETAIDNHFLIVKKLNYLIDNED